MENLLDSFVAFNINGFSYIAYIFTTGGWFILIAVAAIAAIVLTLRDEVENTVAEDQDVL